MRKEGMEVIRKEFEYLAQEFPSVDFTRVGDHRYEGKCWKSAVTIEVEVAPDPDRSATMYLECKLTMSGYHAVGGSGPKVLAEKMLRDGLKLIQGGKSSE